jgi:acyl-CoA-binding protein
MTSALPQASDASPVEQEPSAVENVTQGPRSADTATDASLPVDAALHKSTSGAVLASQLPYPDKFHAAAKLAGAPDHDSLDLDAAERLLLYALFRQATDGSCSGPRPSVFDPIESAKHMSWGRLEGMSPIEVHQAFDCPGSPIGREYEYFRLCD